MPQNEQFYRSVVSGLAVELGQRRNRKEETALILSWAMRDGKILEIGSNLGFFTGLLAKETGSKVVGIDTNSSAFVYKIARWRNKGVKPPPDFARFGEGDLALKNASFDQVILSHVIEHIPQEEHEAFLSEVKRVLKPGGSVIVAVPRELYLGSHTKDHKVLYRSVEQIRQELEANGFTYVEGKDFGEDHSAVVKMRVIK